MPKKRIKKTEVAKDGTSGIKPTKLKPPQGISFSFKYYQDSNSKFSCSQKEVIYWMTLLDRLKALSSLTAQELLVNHSSTLRCLPSSGKIPAKGHLVCQMKNNWLIYHISFLSPQMNMVGFMGSLLTRFSTLFG